MAKFVGTDTVADVNEPVNYIHVEFDGIEQVKGLVTGARIEIIIRGKVNAIEQRDAEGHPFSSVCLEDYSSKIIPSESNAFSDLAEEDD